MGILTRLGYIPVGGKPSAVFQQVKEALGYRELSNIGQWGETAKIIRRNNPRSFYPFPPQGPRVNRYGDVPLQGSGSNISTPAGTGIIASTGILSAGQYQLDYCIIQNVIGDQIFLEIADKDNNVKLTLFIVNPNTPLNNNWQRLVIPVASQQKLNFNRAVASGTQIAISFSWTYINPYSSNDPLSLASFRVQSTEPAFPGEVVGSSQGTISSPPSYPEPQGEVGGGDSGGDGGGAP